MDARIDDFVTKLEPQIERFDGCSILSVDGYPFLLKTCNILYDDTYRRARDEYHLARHMGKFDIGPMVYRRIKGSKTESFVMQKMDMSLNRYLKTQQFTTRQVREMSDTLEALFVKLLHALPGFMCFDLKPQNVVVDVAADGSLRDMKLIDFDPLYCIATSDKKTALLTMKVMFAAMTLFYDDVPFLFFTETFWEMNEGDWGRVDETIRGDTTFYNLFLSYFEPVSDDVTDILAKIRREASSVSETAWINDIAPLFRIDADAFIRKTAEGDATIEAFAISDVLKQLKNLGVNAKSKSRVGGIRTRNLIDVSRHIRFLKGEHVGTMHRDTEAKEVKRRIVFLQGNDGWFERLRDEELDDDITDSVDWDFWNHVRHRIDSDIDRQLQQRPIKR